MFIAGDGRATRKSLERKQMNEAQLQFQAGLTALGQNRVAAALSAFVRAAQLAPHAAPAHHMVGIALQRLGRLAEADQAISRAIALDPKDPDYFSNRALVRCGQEQFALAIADAETAVRLSPTHVGGLCNLGLAQQGAKQYAAAAATFTRLIEIAPSFASAIDNASLAVRSLDDPDEALLAARAFVAAAPSSSIAHSDLGHIVQAGGDVVQADEAFARAVQLAPSDLNGHSRLLFNQNYLETLPDAVRADSLRAFAEALAACATPITHLPMPGAGEKMLRLGFVSGDLREHSVSYFLQAILPALRRRGLQLVAYSTSPKTDSLTEKLRPEFVEWRNITDMSDEAAATLIGEDRIDILFDLAGHTKGSRPRLFAMRPAPIAVLWLGYSATTGNPCIDYVLGDARVLPPANEAHFTERALRMPRSFLCFSPPGTEPNDTQIARTMTFGSFNALNKVGDRTIRLWSTILGAVPGSNLLLKTKALNSEQIRRDTIKRFAALGVDPARVILLGHTPTREAHLKIYGQVHLALDPWPYSGTTTTMEALSMGVPVLTLDEGRFISRVSASLLSAAGLDEWIASDETAYIEKAVRAASNIEALIALRGGLRQQVIHSVLYDADSFAEDFDGVMRAIWRRWCGGVAEN